MSLQTKFRIVALLAVVGVVGAACAELPAITPNQCGNRIVDTGEDCDMFAPNGSSCRAAGSDGACHFDCSGTNACPPTFSCGAVDKICRQATGTYDVANAQTIFATTASLTIADFDGDGRADALTSGPNDVRIHYFDNRVSLSKTLILPITNPKFHVGSLGNDTAADLQIFRTTGLVDVFQGQSDRTLAPVVYSSFPIPNTNISGRAFIARNQTSNTSDDPAQRPTGDDIFAFGSNDKGVGRRGRFGWSRRVGNGREYRRRGRGSSRQHRRQARRCGGRRQLHRRVVLRSIRDRIHRRRQSGSLHAVSTVAHTENVRAQHRRHALRDADARDVASWRNGRCN